MTFVRSTEAIWGIAIISALEPEYMEINSMSCTGMFSEFEIMASVTKEHGVVFTCTLKPNRRHGEEGGEWSYSGPSGIIEALAGDAQAACMLLTGWRRLLVGIQDQTGATQEWYALQMKRMGIALEESLIAS